MKKAEYEASVNQQRATAAKAYDIASNQAQQKVVTEQVRIDQAQKQEQLRVQELEVQRRELELEATVIKQAAAEQRRIEILADAKRAQLGREAAGQAEAILQQGKAEAEVTQVRGAAEAQVILAKGQAEAEAMHKRADAYQQYNQAAVLDKMLGGMPEMARAFAQALAGVDRIAIVSTGDGRASGASQLTGEVAKMVAQMPELVEALTGRKVGDLLAQLQAVGGTPEARAKGAAEPAGDREARSA
jgi:flotillin